MPRVYLVRSFLIMAVLAAADLADGESVLTERALVLSLFVADLWLAGSLVGWVLARLARSAPAIDRVMMTWVIPRIGTFELVRKNRDRVEAAAAQERDSMRRWLTPR